MCFGLRIYQAVQVRELAGHQFNPFTPKSAKFKTEEKSSISFCKFVKKQTAPLESTAQKLSFEWSHTRVSYTDLKVITTLYSIIDSTTWKYCSIAFI